MTIEGIRDAIRRGRLKAEVVEMRAVYAIRLSDLQAYCVRWTKGLSRARVRRYQSVHTGAHCAEVSQSQGQNAFPRKWPVLRRTLLAGCTMVCHLYDELFDHLVRKALAFPVHARSAGAIPSAIPLRVGVRCFSRNSVIFFRLTASEIFFISASGQIVHQYVHVLHLSEQRVPSCDRKLSQPE